MKKQHGNTGNSNAQHELPANSKMQIAVNSHTKAGYVKKAQSDGLNLSQWVLKTLSAAVP